MTGYASGTTCRIVQPEALSGIACRAVPIVVCKAEFCRRTVLKAKEQGDSGLLACRETRGVVGHRQQCMPQG